MSVRAHAFAGDPGFYFFEFSRNGRGQQSVATVRRHYLVLDAHSEALGRQVDARLDRKNGPDRNGLFGITRVMDIEPDEVADAREETRKIARPPQRLFRDMLQLRHRDAWLDGREN